MDSVEAKDVVAYEAEFLEHLRANGKSILSEIESTKTLGKDIDDKLTQFHKDFNALIPALERWRQTSGHDHQKMDLADTSLVSRVCGLDMALDIASKQTSLIAQIDYYLDLSTEGSQQFVVTLPLCQDGRLSCNDRVQTTQAWS